MKDLLTKLMSAFTFLKGKKTSVIVIVLAILAVGYYAAQKGYISEEFLNVEVITSHVEGLFSKDTTKVVVDTLAQPISDTLIK
jgi:uncharacterized membrane protein